MKVWERLSAVTGDESTRYLKVLLLWFTSSPDRVAKRDPPCISSRLPFQF